MRTVEALAVTDSPAVRPGGAGLWRRIGSFARNTAAGIAVTLGSTDAMSTAPVRPLPMQEKKVEEKKVGEKKDAPEKIEPQDVKKLPTTEERKEAPEEAPAPPLVEQEIKGYLEDLKNKDYKIRETAHQKLIKHFDLHVAFHLRNTVASQNLEVDRRRELITQREMPALRKKLFPYSPGVRKEWLWLEDQASKNAFKYVSPSGKEMRYHEVDREYRNDAQARGATTGSTKDWEDYNWALRRIWDEQAEALLNKALEWTDNDQKIIEKAHAFTKEGLETLQRRRVESKIGKITQELEKLTHTFIENSRTWRKKHSGGKTPLPPPPLPHQPGFNVAPGNVRGLRGRDIREQGMLEFPRAHSAVRDWMEMLE